MQQGAARPDFPEIRHLVMAASQALAQLDAARLEELALSCRALNREIAWELSGDQGPLQDSNRSAQPGLLAGVNSDLVAAVRRPRSVVPVKPATHLAQQAREAQGEMAVFARVLDGTRATLNVLNRLRDARAGALEYGAAGSEAGGGWSQPGHFSPERDVPIRNSSAPTSMERGHGDD